MGTLPLKLILLRTWVNFVDVLSEGRCTDLRWTLFALHEIYRWAQRAGDWHAGTIRNPNSCMKSFWQNSTLWKLLIGFLCSALGGKIKFHSIWRFQGMLLLFASSAIILQWDPSVHPGVSKNIRNVLQGGKRPASDLHFLPTEWVFWEMQLCHEDTVTNLFATAGSWFCNACQEDHIWRPLQNSLSLLSIKPCISS